MRCFFCKIFVVSESAQLQGIPPKHRSTQDALPTHLVHLGDALRGPGAPSEHDDALAILPAMPIDELDDLVGEGLPALVRVRARLVRRDRERRVEEEDAGARERDQVAARAWEEATKSDWCDASSRVNV